MHEDKKLTIKDVAEQLGVSISTVSRAISGKGRIGEATRKRVLDYIEACDYHPNSSAKSLALAKTENIAIIIPEVPKIINLPFFYMCLCGVSEAAQARGYDMFVVMISGKDTAHLRHLIDNHKVDGLILGNTHKKDVFAEYLKSKKFPFVTIGSLEDEEIVQIDHDNRGACRDMTAILLSRKWNRIAYMGREDGLVVNEHRFEGYLQAHEDAGVSVDYSIVCRNNTSDSVIRRNVNRMLAKDVDCILCQDDEICNVVLQELREQKIPLPEGMRVASCHNSNSLDNYPVSISSLKFDNTEIGRVACNVLLDLIEGKQVQQKTQLDYQVILKESTK